MSCNIIPRDALETVKHLIHDHAENTTSEVSKYVI